MVNYQEVGMSKKVYLGEIPVGDYGELFEYIHSIKAFEDLKRTLKDPNPVVLDLLEGISGAEIDKDLNEALQKKREKFSEIYEKYAWMKTARLEEIYISEEGKVYKCHCQDSHCNSCDS